MAVLTPGTRRHASAIVAALLITTSALLTIGCGDDDDDTPQTEAKSPSAEKKTSYKVGYISLSDTVPYALTVQDGIKKAAADAGVELIPCDARFEPKLAVACAKEFKKKGAQAVLNFALPMNAKQICAKHGDLPTIGLHFPHEPCAISLMGPDDTGAGRMGGVEMGKYAKENWDCDYTAFVAFEDPNEGEASTKRIEGWRHGFKESCPLRKDKVHVLDGGGDVTLAGEQMTKLLDKLQGDRIVVVAANENGILGAMDGAKGLKREGDVFYGGQGTDPQIRKQIACDPQYIVSVAYFPERYGSLLIPNIVKALDGETIPKTITTDHQVVNRDNIREIYPDTPEC